MVLPAANKESPPAGEDSPVGWLQRSLCSRCSPLSAPPPAQRPFGGHLRAHLADRTAIALGTSTHQSELRDCVFHFASALLTLIVWPRAHQLHL